MNKFLKIFPFILLFAFTLSFTVYADETEETAQETTTIYIHSEEAFVAFAKNCTLDDYSNNLTVFLTCDLDLTDYAFSDIPIFLGEFDGGGHTISGLSEDLSKNYQALFRQVEETAVVKNLNVSYCRSTEKSYVGGIVATNYGTVENCSFTGVLYGVDNVAGICAVNYGYIINCSAEGGIFGETKTAGIVAENSGSVVSCANYAEINTDVSDVDFSISTSILSGISINDNNAEILDIGGIAGNNTGIIQSCTNFGEVGYPHVGYNIGGIAGMQSGLIDDCENYGEVYGRKEVGGIVGQFEPYVSTVYSISKLETLQTEVNTLSQLTSDFSQSTQANSSLLSSNITALTSSVANTKTYADDLFNQTETLLNENVDTLNTISVTATQAISRLSDIMESTEPIGDDITSIITSAEKCLEYLEIISDSISDLYTDELEGKLTSVIASLQQASEDFQNIADITSTATSLEEIAVNIDDLLYYSSSAISNLANASSETAEIINILLELDIDDETADNLMNELSQISSDIQSIVNTLENTADLLSELLDYIESQGEVTFTKTDENYQNTSDSLSSSLSDVIEDVEDINLALNTSINTALEDFDAINAQLTVVLNLLIDIIQDVSADSVTEYFEVDDASYENIDEITAGKIANSINYATIDGDINVGGIAGSISFEYSFDMEDDYKDVTQTSTNSGFAVVIDCENWGDVTVKNDYAGGIVGLQDFGYIKNCLSEANIESTNGSYVGGIVGGSTAMIHSCYSKNNLSGAMYIGGIVGSGVSVKNCYSISQIIGSNGNIGGIAGDLISNGTLENNFFVSDSLGGLNGISYVGKAESITYNELINTENIPNIFETVTINFYVDEAFVKQITIDYSESLRESDLPNIEEKDGYYAVWEEFEMDNITFDTRVNAQYIALVSTLASTETENGLSIILAEGTYAYEYLSVLSEDISDGNVLYQYTVEIIGDNQNIETLRYLTQNDTAYIEIYTGSTWEKMETQTDGLYQVLDLSEYNENQIIFRVIENDFPFAVVVSCSCIALLLMMVFVLVLKRRRIKG